MCHGGFKGQSLSPTKGILTRDHPLFNGDESNSRVIIRFSPATLVARDGPAPFKAWQVQMDGVAPNRVNALFHASSRNWVKIQMPSFNAVLPNGAHAADYYFLKILITGVINIHDDGKCHGHLTIVQASSSYCHGRAFDRGSRRRPLEDHSRRLFLEALSFVEHQFARSRGLRRLLGHSRWMMPERYSIRTSLPRGNSPWAVACLLI